MDEIFNTHIGIVHTLLFIRLCLHVNDARKRTAASMSVHIVDLTISHI